MICRGKVSGKGENMSCFGCPIVSIILPCYNAENVVPVAIESAANSSAASKCELIIVNDGSTDNTGDAIDAACKPINHMRIKVIKTEHQGVSKARNTALDASEGKYIAFLDSDDRISPCMLENMIAYCEEYGADFAYCELTSDITRLCNNAAIPVSISREKVFSTLLYRSSALGFTSVLYRRETIEKYALRFDESLRYGEDFAFLWKYAIRCSTFISFDKPFYYYARDNQASAMHHVCWEMTDVLKAVEQISESIPRTEFALRETYDAYMIPRYIIYLQKSFAAGNNRELFDKLRTKYPSVSCRTVIKKARPVIKASAILYTIAPDLYFRVFRLLSRNER